MFIMYPYRIAELYGLSPRMPNVRLACFDVPETYLPYNDSWIRLYPRSDGNYKNMREEVDEDNYSETMYKKPYQTHIFNVHANFFVC